MASAAHAEPWVVAIPSYDRVGTIVSHTLNLVCSAGIPTRRIFVFADPRQCDEYQKALEPRGVNVVPGEEGVCGQRNRIMSFFPVGTRIVEMDDDIKGVVTSTGSVRSDRTAQAVPVPNASLPAIIDHLFAVASREGCVLWGVYPLANQWMLSRTYALGLTKATTQLVGYINPGTEMKLTVPVMEDYERILRFFSQGKLCMRCDYLGLKTANKGRGGCSSAFTEYKVIKDGHLKKHLRHPREHLEALAAEKLKKLFPDLVTSATKPKVVEKMVENMGLVQYHRPGWSLNFRQKIRYICASDVSGAFAEKLGLGPNVEPQKTVVNGSVVDLRVAKQRRARRRAARKAERLAEQMASSDAKDPRKKLQPKEEDGRKKLGKVRVKDPRRHRPRTKIEEGKEEYHLHRKKRRRLRVHTDFAHSFRFDMSALAFIHRNSKDQLMQACREEGLSDQGSRKVLAERLSDHCRRLMGESGDALLGEAVPKLQGISSGMT
ncbi:unnamed protein product [Symbiodinium natans]|uniref:SAP domain-containing protein n=1 Tax=Symbiodinium natans TaxID=878477 RepID=A0A812P6Z5_9DINO|nr:unnamed protein product [Symbiodinium natans]